MILCLAVVLICTLTGCADYVTFAQAANITPVGFWYGLWHGFLLPFSWFCSLFSDHVAIYAIYNNGGWYNFGFVFGCAGWFSGVKMSN